MPIVGEREREHIAHMFEALVNPVKLVVFTQQEKCALCAETRQLLEEVAAVSDKVSVQAYDLEADRAMAEAYGVARAPATAIVGVRDYGLRFYGLPAGYEFGALIEDIVDVSKGSVELGSRTRQNLQKLTKPVHFQVLTTPT